MRTTKVCHRSGRERGRLGDVLAICVMALALLALNVRQAHAYIDPLIPGFLYQIGYLLLYGILAVGFFFRRSISRLFKREPAGEAEAEPTHDAD